MLISYLLTTEMTYNILNTFHINEKKTKAQNEALYVTRTLIGHIIRAVSTTNPMNT